MTQNYKIERLLVCSGRLLANEDDDSDNIYKSLVKHSYITLLANSVVNQYDLRRKVR